MWEFIPPDLRRLRDEGNVRAIRRQPRTVEQVLEAARDEMNAQDAAELFDRDPAAYHRRYTPRRTLLQRLFWGRQR